MKNNTFSLRFTVGTMFIIATLITGFMAVSWQYYFSQKMAMENIVQDLSQASADLSEYAENLDRNATNTALLLASISQAFNIQANEKDLRNTLAEIMKENDLFYSIYVGSENEDFYQVINLESSPIVRNKISAQANDRWVIIKINGDRKKRIRKTYYYDSQFMLRDVVTTSSNFFPTARPWYIAANADAVFKTKPYLFKHLKITGQTYSIKLPDNKAQAPSAILGIDIVLSSIEEKLSLETLNLGDTSTVESYLYSKSGEIISSYRSAEEKVVIPKSSQLNLSASQRDIVAQTAKIKISNQNDRYPLDFSLSGQPQGYAVDILTLVEQMTGIDFEFINGFSWSELVTKYKGQSLDGLHSLHKSLDGEYTDPIYAFDLALVTRTDQVDIKNYAELAGKKVAVLSNRGLIAKLRQYYPDIEVLEFSDRNSAFKSVSEGKIDAVLDIRPTLAAGLSQYFYQNLKLHDNIVDLTNKFTAEFYILLDSDFKNIVPIINAALANITDVQWNALADKWLKEMSLRDSIMVPYQELVTLVTSLDNHGQIIEQMINGKETLIYVNQIKSAANSEEFFAVIIPKKLINNEVFAQVEMSILVTIVCVLLMLPLAWLFGTPIVNPVRQLRQETRKVQTRQYDEVNLIDSSITEVWELSKAIMEMSKDLQQYEQAQEEFLEAVIKLIAQAIDDKSAYTAGHCNRVPELGIMLAEAVEKSDSERFKAFKFTNDDERREFRIAAWLHDCGKITTPEFIVDKGTKLETNYNRIHEIRTRFEVLWRDAEIDALRQEINTPEDKEFITSKLHQKHQQLRKDFEFVAAANIGAEYMDHNKQERIKAIAEQTWLRHFNNNLGLSPVDESLRKTQNVELPVTENLLVDKPEHIIPRVGNHSFDVKYGIKMEVPKYQYNLGEVYNLITSRGTLTTEDRYKINEHIISTIKMLDNLPFPPELSRVPRYASTHHETLKGTGYPRKLSAEDLSIPERILVIADIFEALTASDRPYKKPKPMSEVIDIMYKMALKEHIDIDIFQLFLETGTHIRYAKAYLKQEQLDETDITKYLAAS